MRQVKSPKSKYSLARPLIMLAALAVAFLLYYAVTRKGMPTDFTYMFDAVDTEGAHEWAPFTEAQQDSVRRALAGFRESERIDSLGPVTLRLLDRLELKDNGIFWQVRQYTVAGEVTGRFSHVLNGYLIPFGASRKTPGKLLSDVRIIRQAYVAGADTCYGPSQADSTWKLYTGNGGFGWKNVRFAPYEGALTAFFEPGIIDIPENLYTRECGKGYSLHRYLDQELGARVPAAAAADSASVAGLIDRRYAPVLRFAIAAMDAEGKRKPGSVLVSFAVDSGGAVRQLQTERSSSLDTWFVGYIAETFARWRLPGPSAGRLQYEFSW